MTDQEAEDWVEGSEGKDTSACLVYVFTSREAGASRTYRRAFPASSRFEPHQTKALGTLDGEAFLLSAWEFGSLVIDVQGVDPERGDYRIDPKVFRPARLEERADAGSPVPP